MNWQRQQIYPASPEQKTDMIDLKSKKWFVEEQNKNICNCIISYAADWINGTDCEDTSVAFTSCRHFILCRRNLTVLPLSITLLFLCKQCTFLPQKSSVQAANNQLQYDPLEVCGGVCSYRDPALCLQFPIETPHTLRFHL